VVVNETLARMFWPNGNALGQVLTAEGDHQIVGVVKDTRTYYGNIERAMPTLYRPATPQGMPRLIARGMNSRQLDAIQAQATALDPRVRVTVDSLNAARDRLLGGSRTGAAVAGTLGVLAVTFAAIGMFSVFAYTVQQRTQEIGIRMALGANAFQVLATVIGESAAPIAIGLCTGAVAAVAAGRLLRSLIFGVSPLDPTAHLSALAILAVAAMGAAFVPARRATRISPLVALRYE
jgi:putative ABC transport system permease protein